MKADRSALFSGGEQLSAAVDRLMEAAKASTNLALVTRVGAIESAILLGRVANWRFLATTDPKGPQSGQTTATPTISATPGNTDTLGTFQGPARINALQLTIPQLSPAAVSPTASPATVAPGSTTLAINPNNNGVRVTRHLQSGAGTEGADLVVRGAKVASLPSPPPGVASKTHWADQAVTLPGSATSGQSSIQVASTGPSSASSFSYQVTPLASSAAAPTTSATDDILQNALQRLCRALQTVKPQSVRSFLNLGAEQIRRELIDLAHHYRGPQGLGANHASNAGVTDSAGNGRPLQRLPADAWGDGTHHHRPGLGGEPGPELVGPGRLLPRHGQRPEPDSVEPGLSLPVERGLGEVRRRIGDDARTGSA